MGKVLIADDAPAILDALGLGLEDEGFEVQTTDDKQFFEVMQRFHPDILLLDVWFGELDGAELCKQIKADTSLASTLVILISTSPDLETIAATAGADHYLQKPIDLDELATLLNSRKAR
jgi:DNA-binding response OmpR family regulator